MEFTFQSYRNLINLLKAEEYTFANYHNHGQFQRSVIMRHDVDNSIEAAVRLGEIEQQEDVKSTYFVLGTSGFYNLAMPRTINGLKSLQEMGHEIGLHFDEKAYPPEFSCEQIVEAIQREAESLSQLLGTQVSTVSMHRPSKKILDANLEILNIINSYGQTFFRDYKYVSDSRRHWREPVETIIKSGQYNRLHILTHAFWYHEQEKTMKECLEEFINQASVERYALLQENISNLGEIL